MPASTAPHPPAAIPESASTARAAAAGELDASALRRLWPEVLEIVKQSSRRTRALLDNAQIIATAGELITLAAPPKLARMIAEDSNTTVLRTALTKVIGGSWRVEVKAADDADVRVEPSHGASAPRPPQVRREPDPRDDPDFDDSSPPPPTVDPEAEALRLLQDQLGARPVEEL